jgi:hypothetical protein
VRAQDTPTNVGPLSPWGHVSLGPSGVNPGLPMVTITLKTSNVLMLSVADVLFAKEFNEGVHTRAASVPARYFLSYMVPNFIFIVAV